MRELELRVEILKRFKKPLTLRFSPQEKGMDNFHRVSCVLCEEYCDDSSCFDCPFDQFEEYNLPGCVRWIGLVVRECLSFDLNKNTIFWQPEDRVATMKQLRLLRKRGKELVTWI